MTRQELRPFWLGLSAGAAVAALSGAVCLGNSETVLRSSFASALTHPGQQLQVKDVASARPISGSEEFWLSAMRRDASSPVKTVSVGDQISLSLSGHRRTFEVASVSDFTPQVTHIDTSSTPGHFVLVSARDANDPAAPPVRFIMEIEQGGAPIVAGRGGRTL
jgi:hypothetical protein